jgi:hypothetical protein
VIIQELEDTGAKYAEALLHLSKVTRGRCRRSRETNGSPQGPVESGSDSVASSEGSGRTIEAAAPPRSPEEEARENAARQLVRDSVLPVLQEMGSIRRDHGKYFLPLANNDSLSIDTGEIPMIELDNGTKIFIDINSRISPKTRRLIEETYPSCKVVSGPAENLDVLMDRILRACGYFSVNRNSGPILAGEDEKIRLFGVGGLQGSSRRNIIEINILSNEESNPDHV